MFEYYPSLFVLIVLIGNSFGQFCDSNDKLSRAFIIDNNIYLGNRSHFWIYNIRDQKVEGKKPLTVDQIFGTGFDSVDSAVYFDIKADCVSNTRDQSPPIDIQNIDEYCKNIEKSRRLVIGFGQIKGGMFGFYSYRLNIRAELETISDKNEMPWGLITSGTLSGTFWVDKSKVDESQHAFTFDQKGNVLYDISTLNKQPILYWKQIQANGDFRGQYSSAKSKLYYGLIDINGDLFGLSENGSFYQLSHSGTDKSLTEGKEFSAKHFFNCDGNSVLLSYITTKPADNENNTNSNNSSTDSNVSNDVNQNTNDSPSNDPNIIETSTTDTNPEESKSEGSSTWIFIILGIILVLIIAFVICFCCSKKSKAKEEELNTSTAEGTESKNDSKTGSASGSTTDSKSGSTSRSMTGSKSDATPGSTTNSKSGSTTGSKVGSSIGSNKSRVKPVKSTTDSVKTVRSKLI